MKAESTIKNISEKFYNDTVAISQDKTNRGVITIKPGIITDVAEYLYKSEGYRFIIASAMHTRKGFEIFYHFSFDAEGLILSLHVILDKNNPRIESLSNIFSASNWIEREMHELFGIDFLHHPNQEKLLSEGNWAEGVYPYRKEFK